MIKRFKVDIFVKGRSAEILAQHVGINFDKIRYTVACNYSKVFFINGRCLRFKGANDPFEP